MENRLVELLAKAIDMLIDEEIMFVDILDGLETTEEELEKFGLEY